ncbi:MAG TPA: hypothetical protein VIR15_16120 [Intrasporangium sp.]|jgi:hypothetical protein|uniref:hypothetical protein n=1 Tax=Intrasporangium sp. TaxID=1925024 RepID=UPI002F947730
MRRFIVLVITALAGLVLFPANPAHAGGPTSVLVVDHDGRHAAGALTGSSAYDSLARALDIENPPNGESRPADSFMAGSIRLTWMIHDVQPWRVDALTITGSDVWVSTLLMRGGESLFSGSESQAEAVWHRPANTALLLTALTDLGVLGGYALTAPTSTADSIAPVTGAAAGPERSSMGVPPAALAAVAALSLSLGALAGRSWRLRGRDASPAGEEATAEVRATAGASPAAYATGREHLKGFTLR